MRPESVRMPAQGYQQEWDRRPPGGGRGGARYDFADVSEMRAALAAEEEAHRRAQLYRRR
jgi:hypothetical protein